MLQNQHHASIPEREPTGPHDDRTFENRVAPMLDGTVRVEQRRSSGGQIDGPLTVTVEKPAGKSAGKPASRVPAGPPRPSSAYYWPRVRLVGGMYTVTSNFGRRKDPFTKKCCETHEGADIIGPKRRVVPPPGRVLYLGPASGYKRMAATVGYDATRDEVFVSVYGHLVRTEGKAGRIVDGVDDSVGRWGKVGRSTGAHLHVEVRIPRSDKLKRKLKAIWAGTQAVPSNIKNLILNDKKFNPVDPISYFRRL